MGVRRNPVDNDWKVLWKSRDRKTRMEIQRVVARGEAMHEPTDRVIAAGMASHQLRGERIAVIAVPLASYLIVSLLLLIGTRASAVDAFGNIRAILAGSILGVLNVTTYVISSRRLRAAQEINNDWDHKL